MLKYVFLTKLKVFNLMSRTNQTRHLKWYKTCKCKCRLINNIIINKDGMMINADVNINN